jgi:hypothetical protein
MRHKMDVMTVLRVLTHTVEGEVSISVVYGPATAQ